ncbi:MAG: ArsR family transcriptional regulator [Alphaproteobacteria bacterium]|nr:MAG: ArsR family transcriptional regulator [Alphaproteobacteria bacterium]
MTDRVCNVLFLCTGNSARSILGEALLNHHGAGRFKAFSAGSYPKGKVHPVALEVLADLGLPTTGLRSKIWDEFAGSDAPDFDFIFTVCDDAAGESCPIWPGHPMTAHWGIDDPAAVTGEGQRAAFLKAARHLETRLDILLALAIADLDQAELRRRLQEIGRSDGASAPKVTS